MREPVRLAVVGLGRMGAIHALHASELARGREDCRLAALVDEDLARARRLGAELGPEIRAFSSVGELIASGASDAAIVATPTRLHREHATALVEAGQRVLLEKPMTDSLASDRNFAARLNRSAPDALMLAFQRRFDPVLLRAKELLDDGAVGRPFKIVSVLEDSNPLPDGYSSPGLLEDMSIHNIDEILWLAGHPPSAVASIGSQLFSGRLTTASENYDDGFLYLWFENELAGQITVSRNHVPGYRVETWIFGEQGSIHCGHFESSRWTVSIEAHRRGSVVTRETVDLRRYERPVPEFVDRFGPAYKAEVRDFVERCHSGDPFTVNQNDGLRAMEVIDAAVRGAVRADDAARVES